MTQTEPLNRAVATFRAQFNREPDLIARAPGRVNLIGEHTDYNDGFVLPCAIDRETVVAIGLAENDLIQCVASDFDQAIDQFSIGGIFTPSGMDWANYVRGMAKHVALEGIALKPAKIAIAGNVPLGSGLSSSASLEIAVGLALARHAGVQIDAKRLAQIAQQAENQFVGCACGIMDQLIATSGQADHALLIDCRSLDCRPVKMPENLAVVVAHSGVRHAHAGGEYNDRRAQCEAAASHYGVKALRDLDLATLEQGKAGLDDLSFRRARHVVTENARTTDAALALETGDLARLGQLMAQSHASMCDDFEITVSAVDQLAAIMGDAIGNQGGARMTGGGFGGCVIAVTPLDLAPAIEEAIARDYRDPDGNPADVFICKASAGASCAPWE